MDHPPPRARTRRRLLAKIALRPKAKWFGRWIPNDQITTKVRQSPGYRAWAEAHVDGYLWFGRPWLSMQADPFVMKRALQLARTTPY